MSKLPTFYNMSSQNNCHFETVLFIIIKRALQYDLHNKVKFLKSKDISLKIK